MIEKLLANLLIYRVNPNKIGKNQKDILSAILRRTKWNLCLVAILEMKAWRPEERRLFCNKLQSHFDISSMDLRNFLHYD
jgi:hypothetical protein